MKTLMLAVLIVIPTPAFAECLTKEQDDAARSEMLNQTVNADRARYVTPDLSSAMFLASAKFKRGMGKRLTPDEQNAINLEDIADQARTAMFRSRAFYEKCHAEYVNTLPEPSIGMTTKQAYDTRWDWPIKRVKTVTKNIVIEEWTFDRGKLTFENDAVISIQYGN